MDQDGWMTLYNEFWKSCKPPLHLTPLRPPEMLWYQEWRLCRVAPSCSASRYPFRYPSGAGDGLSVDIYKPDAPWGGFNHDGE